MRKASSRKTSAAASTRVDDYRHDDKRTNNPAAGLTTDYAAAPCARTRYECDPHCDPQLVWAGKTEHTSFEVGNVPLYGHERISMQAIILAVQREETRRGASSPTSGCRCGGRPSSTSTTWTGPTV